MTPRLVYVEGSDFPVDISIGVIAECLSHERRYAGQSSVRFYSVAEHSYHVAMYVYRETGSRVRALSALMHDATEAYLRDIPSPLKSLMPDYTQLEKYLHDQIYLSYCLLDPCDVCDYADKHICKDEVLHLFDDGYDRTRDWGLLGPELCCEIQCWGPTIAERKFLNAFDFFANTKGVSV